GAGAREAGARARRQGDRGEGGHRIPPRGRGPLRDPQHPHDDRLPRRQGVGPGERRHARQRHRRATGYLSSVPARGERRIWKAGSLRTMAGERISDAARRSLPWLVAVARESVEGPSGLTDVGAGSDAALLGQRNGRGSKADLPELREKRVRAVAAPYGERAAGSERSLESDQALAGVETRVRAKARPVRAVVDVEQDHVDVARALREHVPHVGPHELDARVLEGTLGDVRQVAAYELDDRLDLLDDDDVRVGRRDVEHAPQRRAEPQAADDDALRGLCRIGPGTRRGPA